METINTTAPSLPITTTHTGITLTKVVPIDALTGLRFVAAILVYLSHMPVNTKAGMPDFILNFIQAGYNGVGLFFTLSGFVICYNYYDKFEKRVISNLWPFFVARFARIYPAYLLFFLFYFTANNLTTQFEHSKRAILQQLTLTQAWNPDFTVSQSYDAVAWSVSVEAFLYLIFPFLAHFLLKYCSRINQLLILGGIALLSTLGLAAFYSLNRQTQFPTFLAEHYVLYQLPLARLPDFVLGCVAARIYMLWKDKPVSRIEQRIGTIVLTLSIISIGLVMLCTWDWVGPFKFGAGYCLSFVCIIFCLARYQSLAAKLLSTRWCILLGEASYVFYLIHREILGRYRASIIIPGELHVYLFNIILFLLINMLALGLFTYFETPLRRFIRRKLLPRTSPQKGY